MKYGALNANTSVLNVRNAANASAPIVTQINRGDVVTGELDTVSNWLNVKSIGRNGGANETLNAFCNAAYLTLRDMPAAASPVVTVSVDGYNPASATFTKA